MSILSEEDEDINIENGGLGGANELDQIIQISKSPPPMMQAEYDSFFSYQEEY